MIDIDEVREKLRSVLDPEIGINLVDLGLIYDISEVEEGSLVIKMTMTTPGCPAHDRLSEAVEWAAAQVFGAATVKVEVVWDPPWTPDMMSKEARSRLSW